MPRSGTGFPSSPGEDDESVAAVGQPPALPVREVEDLLVAQVSVPTAREIASVTASLIRDRALPPRTLLPTVRNLASRLHVSPGTISAAWAALRERGLITGRGKAGVHVAEVGQVSFDHFPGLRHDLRFLLPDPALLPDLSPGTYWSSSQAGLSDYYAEPITPGLAESLRGHEPALADRALMVAEGSADALTAVLRSLSVAGDRVLVESPTAPLVLRICRRIGLIPIPIPVALSTFDPSDLRRGLRARPVAYLRQPRGHVPLGDSTHADVAQEVARALRGTNCLAVEYDELGDLAQTSLREASSPDPRQTVTITSYEKAYGPDIRLASIAGPDRIINDIHSRLLTERQWISRILQGALAWMVLDASTQTQIETARKVYTQRTSDLRDRLPGLVGGTEGMSLWLPVREERAAVDHLRDSGVLVHPGRLSMVDASDPPHVRVATSRLVRDVSWVSEVLHAASRA